MKRYRPGVGSDADISKLPLVFTNAKHYFTQSQSENSTWHTTATIMEKLRLKSNPEVERVFSNYPDPVRLKILNLRRLILESADEISDINELEETLKWGEPSYLTRSGSTIRIDWKKKNPDQYAIYFKCTSRLVPVFRKVFTGKFNFDGDRALVFQIPDVIPETELKQCIKAGLTYHKVKHLPLLGLE